MSEHVKNHYDRFCTLLTLLSLWLLEREERGEEQGAVASLCVSDGARDSAPAAPQRHGHGHGHHHNHKHLRCTWAQGLRRRCRRETEATST